jgi:prolyl oligopeptidase PreP (S9A serine peptidase family)
VVDSALTIEQVKRIFAFSNRVSPALCTAITQKIAATLQAAQGCDTPTLIRIQTKGGHGAGKPTTKIIARPN